MSPFESFINRVDTKQDIACIRNAILVHKMRGIKKTTIKSSNPKSLPEQLRLYLDYQKHCERVKACQTSSIKTKEQTAFEHLKNVDCQKRTAAKELSFKRSRVDILRALANKLNEEIKSEEEMAQKIDSNLQVLNVPNVLQEATVRVNKTVEALKDFSAKGVFSATSKANCMNEVEKNIYNVPNSLIFDILTNMLKSRAEDSLFDGEELSRENIQGEMLDKFQELKIQLGFQLIASKRSVDNLKQACSMKIQKIESQLELLLDNTSMYYEEDDDDIVGEFVSVLIAKLIQEGKMKLLNERIKPLKEQSETNVKFYENLMQNIQDSNQLISDKVAAIQSSIVQAHLINEKSKFSNMKLMRTVNNLKLEKYQQTNRTMLNQTVSGFFDNSIESGLYQTELELFLSSSLKGEEKIDLKLENLLASSSITRLFERDMIKFVKCLKTLHELSHSAQKCTIELPQSPVHLLNGQFLENLEKSVDQNRKEINETFDSITRMNVNINSLFVSIQAIIKFIQENPLKKFVDPKQKYENKSYLEYEKEYKLYYKMIKQ